MTYLITDIASEQDYSNELRVKLIENRYKTARGSFTENWI